GGGRTTIALRAELDALPITERSAVPWRSTTDAMHACGHDIHLAALVAVARAARTIDLPARLVALLQPREEGTYSGAKDIAAAGVADDWSAVVAAHVQPQLTSAVTAVTPGPVNASTTEFTVSLSGRGGHSGYPHTVDDSVLALSATVVALQHVAAGTIDPVEGVTMMVTQISGGTAANIVPDFVSARGTVRAMSESNERAARQAMERIVTSTAAAYGCSGEITFHPGEPALVNDPAIARSTRAYLAGMGREVDDAWRSFGSDDFSHFASRTRTLMLFVGTGAEHGGLHDSTYVPSDGYIPLVADALIAGFCGASAACERG
ncbi:MAG: M20 family metallopeptidase, partial [Actinomycetia bacterium]|nr:M20 family metallopeptidase [Actinomycetes bacterium]